MSVRPAEGGGHSTNYRLGQKEVIKKRWIPNEERLRRPGNKLTHENEIQQQKSILSIRLKSLKAGTEREAPKLDRLARRYWVPLNIGSDTDPHYVLANIKSITKRTGLTKEEIKNSAYGVTEKPSKKKDKKINVDPKSADQRGGLLKKDSDPISVEQANLEDTFESSMNIKEAVFSEFNYVGRLGDRKPSIEEKDLIGMTKRISGLRSKLMADGSISSDILTRRRVKLLNNTTLIAYVSKKGEVYLCSESKSLGKGASKEVFSATNVAARDKLAVAVPFTEEGDQAQKYEKQCRELKFLKKAQGIGVCKYHNCFEINLKEGKGKRLGLILHNYNGGELQNSLKTLVKDPTSITHIKSKIFIMNRMAEALTRLHSPDVNIVHGDIKPANIFLAKK